MTGTLAASPWTTWAIAAAATAGVITRPFSTPEFVWAVIGRGILLVAVWPAVSPQTRSAGIDARVPTSICS